MKKFLSLLLVMTLLCGVVGCGREITQSENKSDIFTENYQKAEETKKTPKKYTDSQVIACAKEYLSWIEGKIADFYGLKFAYRPNYGTFSVGNVEVGKYRSEQIYVYTVVIKGNISGYKDDYKTDYVSGLPFRATIKVKGLSYGTSIDLWSVEVFRS